MAIGTALESESIESELIDFDRRLGSTSRQMALDAGDLDMTAREPEPGLVVIESGRGLPALQGMAGLAAVRSKLCLVNVTVARKAAFPIQPQVGMRQVLALRHEGRWGPDQ